MKQLSIVKYADHIVGKSQRFIYLGEVPNMEGFSACIPITGDVRQNKLIQTSMLTDIPMIGLDFIGAESEIEEE